MFKKILMMVPVIMLISFSCSKKTVPFTSSQPFESKWMITEMLEIPRDTLIASGAYLDFSDLKKSRAYLGCNQIFWHTNKRRKNKLQLSNFATTEMYCENRQQMEALFLQLQKKIHHYRLEGHFIYVYDKGNKALIKAVNPAWD